MFPWREYVEEADGPQPSARPEPEPEPRQQADRTTMYCKTCRTTFDTEVCPARHARLDQRGGENYITQSAAIKDRWPNSQLTAQQLESFRTSPRYPGTGAGTSTGTAANTFLTRVYTSYSAWLRVALLSLRAALAYITLWHLACSCVIWVWHGQVAPPDSLHRKERQVVRATRRHNTALLQQRAPPGHHVPLHSHRTSGTAKLAEGASRRRRARTTTDHSVTCQLQRQVQCQGLILLRSKRLQDDGTR
jgi:hypothetical protein